MEYKKLEDIIEFNPTETLKKGTVSKKIPMDKLGVFSKYINSSYDPISCIIPHFLRKNNSPRCVTKRFLLLRIIPHNSHTHHEYGRLYL